MFIYKVVVGYTEGGKHETFEFCGLAEYAWEAEKWALALAMEKRNTCTQDYRVEAVHLLGEVQFGLPADD